MQKREEWRPVEGWPYEVSSFGSVRRIGGVKFNKKAKKILAPCDNNRDGYLVVNLSDGGRRLKVRINRLVCLTFLGKPPTQKHHAAHFDGNRSNNELVNLRWATAFENNADKIRHGRTRKGKIHPARRFSIQDILDIRAADGRHVDIAARYGVTRPMICLIKNRRTYGDIP